MQAAVNVRSESVRASMGPVAGGSRDGMGKGVWGWMRKGGGGGNRMTVCKYLRHKRDGAALDISRSVSQERGVRGR